MFYYTNGERYFGDFKNEERNGKGKFGARVGICDYPNGDRYDGDWKDGEKHGNGR